MKASPPATVPGWCTGGGLCFKENFAARGTIIGITIALREAFTWGIYTIAVRISLMLARRRGTPHFHTSFRQRPSSRN